MTPSERHALAALRNASLTVEALSSAIATSVGCARHTLDNLHVSGDVRVVGRIHGRTGRPFNVWGRVA